jgi:peptide/nickel transport system permease protein
MIAYLLRRVGETLVTLLLVTLLVFVLTRLTGDPTTLLLGPEASDAQREYFRHDNNLDRSLIVQYITYLRHAVAGDFGVSFRLDEPAIDVVVQALGPTLKLAGLGMLISILIGLPLGVWAAASRAPIVKRFVNWYAALGQALPPFWVGLTFVMVFALWIPIFPTSGYGGFKNYILPAMTLGVSTSAAIAALAAANMAEVLKSDFIQLERVLGLSEWRILLKHALPIVTYIGLQFGLILGGAIVTERVFAWPGIGQRIVEAILERDYPVVQAVVLVTALLFMLINLLVDILYMVLDPRLRA